MKLYSGFVSYFKKSLTKASTPLAMAAMLAVFATSAQASVRFYNHDRDSVGTLRVCYKVTEAKRNPSREEVVFTRIYTGENKLSRNNYPSLPTAPETVTRVGGDEYDAMMFAFAQNLFVCEISWEYGLFWVVSSFEASGDR